MNAKTLQGTTVSVFLILLLAVTVFAQSDIPHQFAGNVVVNGAAAADGTFVVVKVGTTEVAATTTNGGKYGYDSVFMVPDPYRDREGDTIEFYVSGVKGGEFVFVNGGHDALDLSVTVPNEGGGGGGFSGGGVPPVVSSGDDDDDDVETAGCVENWICTGWFECFGGSQSRVCSDVNDCGTENNKPVEKQSCSVQICTSGEQRCDGDDIVVCSQNEDAWVMVKTCENECNNGLCGGKEVGITGLLTGLPALAGIFAVIFIAGILIYWKKK